MKQIAVLYFGKAYKCIKDNIFISAFIVALPTIWISVIINNLGFGLGLCDTNKILTFWGWIWTIIIFFIAIAINISKNQNEKIKTNVRIIKAEFAAKMISELINGLDSVSDTKYNTLKKIIDKVRKGKMKPPLIVSNPRLQLEEILSAINDCLVIFLNNEGHEFTKNDLYITLAFVFQDDKDNWQWIKSTSKEVGLDFNTLLTNKNTAFYKLLYENQKFLFINKKEEVRDIRYVYDEGDNAIESSSNTNKSVDKPIGSITALRMFIPHDGGYIKSILSVSTYGKRFADSDDEIVKENMDYILNEFEKRIQVELCLLYLKHLSEKLQYII